MNIHTRKTTTFILAACMIFFFLLSLLVSSQESTTMDEQAHIPASYTYVNQLDMRLNPEHPPLLKILAGLPLQLLSVSFPYESKEWRDGINEQWTLGNKFLHSNDAQQITVWARFPIILVSLLLGWFVFKWTRERAGYWAGTAAAILFFFDPNIIGHGHYVTTDIGIAAFIYFALYFFLSFLRKPSAGRFAVAAIFFGLAQLAKFSAVMLFPYFGFLVTLWALTIPIENSSWKQRAFIVVKYWLFFAGICVTAFVPIWIVYTIYTWNMPAEKIFDIANAVFGNSSEQTFAKSAIDYIVSLPVLGSLAEYFLGLFMVLVRVSGGNTYFFNGTVSNHATPLYFPAVFFWKETLPLLVFIMFSSLYASVFSFFGIRASILRNKTRFQKYLPDASAYVQKYFTEIALFGFIVLYAYASITSNLNIGFRHLFPILPLAYTLVAIAIATAFKRLQKTSARNTFAILTSLIFLWAICIPIIHFPSYLSYFNEISGGPKQGYTLVTDSNYDWGQDLRRLKQWVNNYNISCAQQNSLCQTVSGGHSIEKIRIDYFGGSNPFYYFGDSFIPAHGEDAPQTGWYALSAGFLQESIYKNKGMGNPSYEWITRYPLIGRAGDSIFIYYVSPEKQ